MIYYLITTPTVHRVVTNKGSRSPGLDEKPVTTIAQYKDLISQISSIVNNPKSYKAKLLKRLHIESPKGSGRLRPYPFIRRQMSPIFVLISPRTEELHDVYNYGFRPHQSPSWALGNLCFLLGNTRPNVGFRYVIKVDIRKCFDPIDPDFLKIKTPIIPVNILNSWLNCGYVYLKISKNIEPIGLGVGGSGLLIFY
uniref:Reverse transcriptase domain-containing protein n=1 Tax=Caulerpa verticillata TaxID=177082 RepID=A0A386B098_9CHLO|nr:hypothetical protein [Caulerpa verticillata]AYC65109.1 hypothetical protein [Caulerpa verticillata]